MALFKVGDCVRWIASDHDSNDIIGTITAVIESDPPMQELNRYDILFTFGAFSLYGNQIALSAAQRRLIP